MELLLLGSLRYLGRGWTFDDLEEATAISFEVHHNFFHQFIHVGSSILYPTFVVVPQAAEEAQTHMVEFSKAGCHGCVGSSDATHIAVEKCSYRLWQNHLGGKTKLTTRTFNLTVNHCRRIISTTPGYPGRWNDKTLVLFDDFVRGIYEGKVLSDVQFELFEYDAEGNVKSQQYKGPWLIVDNGYLNWSATIPPFKITADQKEIRWSQWIESLRKDVECTFGILKGRWQILKTGIRLHGVEVVDDIWRTCCALHNWLLDLRQSLINIGLMKALFCSLLCL